MRIYEWELLAVCYHLEKSCEYKLCDSSHIRYFLTWLKIREPKVRVRFFNKLKNEIKKSILRFCFYFNKEDEIQITDFNRNPCSLFLLSIIRFLI